MKHTQWTHPLVRAEAKKYTTRRSFKKESRGAYEYACKAGLLAKISAHMPGNKIKWTMPLLIKCAKKYQTRGAFQKGSKGAYLYAFRNKLLDKICAHMHYARPPDILRDIRNAVKDMKTKRAKKHNRKKTDYNS